MKKDLPFLLIILLVSILLYSGLLFFPSQQLYPAKDWWSQNYFWKLYERGSFERDGEIPLWNNAVFSGAPFLGHPAASTYYYPLNIFFMLNDSNSVFKFYLLFHTLLAGISIFYLLKRLLEDRFISLFGSIAFICGGAWIAKISYGQLTNMVVISYVPLLFLMLLNLWKKPKLALSLAMGLIWGIQFNAGNQHLFYISALSMGLLILYFSAEEIILIKKMKPLLEKYLLLIISALVAVGIGAGQLLPTMETAAWSIRTLSNYEYCTTMSLPAWQTLSYIFPNIFGSPMNGSYIGAENYTELYGYAGIFPLLLAIYFLFKRKNRDAYPWIFLAVSALLLSFGKYTPLYKLCYKFIPGLDLFRIPSTFLFIYVFSLIIVSCYGLKIFLESDKDDKRKKSFSILLILFILAALTILILRPVDLLIKTLKPALYSSSARMSITYAGIHTLIFLCVFAALYFLKFGKRITSVCLIIFLLLDLLLIAFPLLKTTDIEKQLKPNLPLENILALNDEPYFRIYDIKSIPQETSFVYGVQKITGLDPIILKHYFNFTNLLLNHDLQSATEQLPITRIGKKKIENPIILDLLNVKYILAGEKLDSYDNFRLIGDSNDKDGDKVYIYINTTALPRSWLVYKTEEIAGLDDFNVKIEKGFNPLEAALIPQGSGFALKNDKFNPKNASESVKIKDYRANRILIEAVAKSEGLVVISEVWMPGWVAKVNGKEKSIIRTNFVMRGVPISKGKNLIELRYYPKTFKAGILITFLVGLIVFIFLIMASVRKITSSMRPYIKRTMMKR